MSIKDMAAYSAFAHAELDQQGAPHPHPMSVSERIRALAEELRAERDAAIRERDDWHERSLSCRANEYLIRADKLETQLEEHAKAQLVEERAKAEMQLTKLQIAGIHNAQVKLLATLQRVEREPAVSEKEIVFVENEHGVVIELRHWGRDGGKWLDYYACEWRLLEDGRWESQNWGRQRGREIGRWTGLAEIDQAVKRAQENQSGWKNWVSHSKAP